MLTLEGFAKQYLYGARLFGGVDAEFRDGEVVSVYGGEGSGKTSFLKALCGAEKAEGRVLLDGVPVERKTDRVIMVFEDGAVFPFKSVYDNLAYPLVIRGMDKTEIASRVIAAAEEMGIGGCLSLRARALSPAEKRRMSLARLVVRDARLCLVDEPSAGLSREDAESVFADFLPLVRRLAGGGTTVIYSTSDRGEAVAAADRMAVLAHGELKQLAPPSVIRRAPASIWAAQALDAHYNFVKCVLTEQNGRLNLVFGEDDVLDAEFLRGRSAAGYMGKEVLAGWFPEDAGEGKALPVAYTVGERDGVLLCTEEGVTERAPEARREARVRPDIRKTVLFDAANEFSIMSDNEEERV